MKDNDELIKTLKRLFWDDRFKEQTDLNITRKLLMLNFSFIACTFFLIPFGILSLYEKAYLIGVFDLLTFFFIAIARFYYVKTFNYKFLTYLIIDLLGIYFLFLVYSGGANYSGPLWSYIFPVTVMFMLGRKVGRNYVVVFLVLVTLI
ncbi:MAG: hypothetical protein KDC52_18520 [Ignavibacteriae bacterium]|nr:hypothetical protein [Ignavibacteriota bacterium]